MHSSLDNTFETIRDHVKRLLEREGCYQMAILNISRLLPYYRQAKFQIVIDQYLNAGWPAIEKTFFRLPNNDLILTFRTVDDAVTQHVFYQLRALLAYDPMMNMPSFGRVDGNFLQLYDMSDNATVVLTVLKQRLSELRLMTDNDSGVTDNRRKNVETKVQAIEVGQLSVAEGLENSAEESPNAALIDHEKEVKRVASLAVKYRNIDMAAVLRRSCIGRFDPEKNPQWSMAYSLLDPQMMTLMTHRDRRVDADDQLLNRYLGHILQYRLWDYLIKLDDQKILRRAALPVHPELVLSPMFRRFDEALARGMPQQFMLQFHLSDIYADYRLFHFVRQHLHRRGYLLCLSEIRYEMLPTLDLQALGMDYLFLQADVDWPYYQPQLVQQIKQEITEIGIDRVCLQKVNSESILRFGKEIGIRHFSGEVIDAELRRLRQVSKAHQGADAVTYNPTLDTLHRRSRS